MPRKKKSYLYFCNGDACDSKTKYGKNSACVYKKYHNKKDLKKVFENKDSNYCCHTSNETCALSNKSDFPKTYFEEISEYTFFERLEGSLLEGSRES